MNPQPAPVIGYCTNVHAGASLEQTRRNLEEHALAVKRLLNPAPPLPVGLWLSARAARKLREGDGAKRLRDWLAERDLLVFTINGFPFGDFHQSSVKHRVYHPTWTERARLAYTLDLIHILGELLPVGGEGGISTLPLGWAPDFAEGEDAAAACLLRGAVAAMIDVADSTGRLIHLDVEPEPGCRLQRSEDVLCFFEHHLFSQSDREAMRRHVRICHDICHAAVMFEDQAQVLQKYRAAGIAIGKVQVSNALRIDLRSRSARERCEALAALRPFTEDRYLHQTMIEHNGQREFFEDLPQALERFAQSDLAGDEWRVHYHLPIFLDSPVRPPAESPQESPEERGMQCALGTTQAEIDKCLAALRPEDFLRNASFEVETYTWDVLPEDSLGNLRKRMSLAEGIARELAWLRERLAKRQADAAGESA